MDSENNKLNETNAGENVNPEEVKEVVKEETKTPEIASQTQTTIDVAGDNPPPKKKKKFLIPIIIGVVLVVLVAVFFILTSTHVICLEHEWNKATCTEAKTCEYCGKTDGEAKGHEWVEATCLTPKTCSRCDETEGETVDHKKESIIEKSPTLIFPGKETVSCSVCDLLIEEKEIPVKEMKSLGKTFNITEDDLVEYLEEVAEFNLTKTKTYDTGSGYSVVGKNGIQGVVVFVIDGTGEDKFISSIGISLNNKTYSMAIIGTLAQKSAPSLVKEDAVDAMFDGTAYKKDGTVIHSLKQGSNAAYYLTAEGYYNERFAS